MRACFSIYRSRHLKAAAPHPTPQHLWPAESYPVTSLGLQLTILAAPLWLFKPWFPYGPRRWPHWPPGVLWSQVPSPHSRREGWSSGPGCGASTYTSIPPPSSSCHLHRLAVAGGHGDPADGLLRAPLSCLVCRKQETRQHPLSLCPLTCVCHCSRLRFGSRPSSGGDPHCRSHHAGVGPAGWEGCRKAPP